MKSVEFKRNWCDYLTPCKHQEDIMVGEYDCVEKCPYCKGSKENERPERDVLDAKKYFDEWSGEVICSYPKY